MVDVTIYTRDFCSYCTRAVALLRSKDVPFTEIDAGGDFEKRREMVERSGRNTFPQVFIDGRHIGGSDDLLQLEAEGGLDPLLERA